MDVGVRILTLTLLAFIAYSVYIKPVYAADTPVPIAVLEDPAATLTFKSILTPEYQSQFSKPKPNFVAGYTRSAFWFKTSVTPYNGTVWLEFKPPYLDQLDVYWRNEQGQFQQVTLGDLSPFADRPIPHRHFVLPINQHEPFEMYVRLKTTSSTILSIRAWEPAAFQRYVLIEYFILALVIGGLISLLIFNLRQALWREDAIYRAFLIYLTILIVALLSYNGFFEQFVMLPFLETLNVLPGLLTALLLFATTLLYQRILHINRKQRPYFFSIVVISYAISILLGTGAVFGFYVDVAPIFAIWVILFYCLWLIDSVRLLFKKHYDSVWYVIATVSGLIGAVSMIFVLVGVFSLDTVGLYAFQVGSVISILSFQMAISGRVKRGLEGQHQLELQNQITHKLLEKETSLRKLQEQFLAMITHEIKTPLSIIKLVLSEKDINQELKIEAQQSAQDINNVISRCAIMQKIEHPNFVFKKQAVSLDELVQKCLRRQDHRNQIHYQKTHVTDSLIETDSDMLSIILTNLIDNALKYSATGQPIQLTLQNQFSNGSLILDIINPIGEYGVPDPVKVFDKYYRAPKAYAKSGSGLGLFIVKQLTLQLGANIDYLPNEHYVHFRLTWLRNPIKNSEMCHDDNPA